MLATTVLPGDFIHSALDWSPEPKVVPVQSENFFSLDRIEDPVGELDFDFLHPTIAGLADDFKAFDQTEASGDFLVTG